MLFEEEPPKRVMISTSNDRNSPMDKRMFQRYLLKWHSVLCMCKCPYLTTSMAKSRDHRWATPLAVDFVSQSYFVPYPTRRFRDVVGRLLCMEVQSICQLMRISLNRRTERELSLGHLIRSHRRRHSNRAYHRCCYSHRWSLIRRLSCCPIVQRN